MSQNGPQDRTDRPAAAATLSGFGEVGLRRVLDSASDHAVVATDAARRILLWNEGAHRLFGWQEAEVLGRPCDLMFTPEDRAAGAPMREQQLAMAEGHAPNERWHIRRDGSHFWGSGWVAPLRGPEGASIGLVKVMRDATAERTGAERLRLALEIAGGLAWEYDPATGLATYDAAAARRLGLPRTVMPAEEAWLRFIPAEEIAVMRDGVAAALDPLGDGRYLAEHRVIGAPAAGAPGGRRWFQSLGQAWFEGESAARRAVRLVCVSTDVTLRREAEERRRLLVNELNHRVKNTLATVQSLARQTGRAAAHAADFLPVFEARLLALARAHDLLTREDWTGATVEEVTRGALAPHGGGGRVGLSGPVLRVGPRAAVALAMALQELATNAAKHGALSAPDGRVDISWEAGDGSAGQLIWQELGGPPAAPPEQSRRGFGTRLLTQGLRGDLGEAAALEFGESGLRCTIRFPLEQER